MGHSIYLADDEKSIGSCSIASSQATAIPCAPLKRRRAAGGFRQEPAELVILDIMMPARTALPCAGASHCFRYSIILLTAKDSELDYVMGISQGSDDYSPSLSPTILLMKVKALLRRVEMDRGKTAAAEDELRYGDIRYSATENAVFCGSTIVR